MTSARRPIRPEADSKQAAGIWQRLAEVARERAAEQSSLAATASDTVEVELHQEKQAYLVRLAEVYDERAKNEMP